MYKRSPEKEHNFTENTLSLSNSWLQLCLPISQYQTYGSFSCSSIQNPNLCIVLLINSKWMPSRELLLQRKKWILCHSRATWYFALKHTSTYFSLYKIKNKIVENIYTICFHKFLFENKWEIGKYEEMVKSGKVAEFWNSWTK